MEWPPPQSEQRREQPLYQNNEPEVKSKKIVGWCCMCGPSALLLLVLACWPVGAYLFGILFTAGLIPPALIPVFIIVMIAVWPILAIAMLIGIPIGFLVLNKKNIQR